MRPASWQWRGADRGGLRGPGCPVAKGRRGGLGSLGIASPCHLRLIQKYPQTMAGSRSLPLATNCHGAPKSKITAVGRWFDASVDVNDSRSTRELDGG